MKLKSSIMFMTCSHPIAFLFILSEGRGLLCEHTINSRTGGIRHLLRRCDIFNLGLKADIHSGLTVAYPIIDQGEEHEAVY